MGTGEKSYKEVLLSTYMQELPLGKRIKKRFDPNRPLTLSEFIKLNPFLRYENDGFIGPGNEKHDYYFFHKNSLMWKELKNFLIESGFTSLDWAMLIPDQKVKRRKDLSYLSKFQILSLSVCIISPGSSTSNKMFNVTVSDLLKKEFIMRDKQMVAIQNRLRELGFSEEDGPFMCIKKGDSNNRRLLKKIKNISTRQKYFDVSVCT